MTGAPAARPGPAVTTPDAGGWRPDPPDGASNLVLVILDSLRFDSWAAARMPVLGRLGPVERRWSYASWTAPAHYNLLMGLLPHSSPTQVHASEYYQQDFRRYTDRLAVPDIEFSRFLPELYLPRFLRDKLGYHTCAKVSMPVLNPATPLNQGFDDYQLMPVHNDLAAMVDGLAFPSGRPAFCLLNTGETHYPYTLPGDEPPDLPHLHGVHGTLRNLRSEHNAGMFSAERLAELRERQIRAATYLDSAIERLLDVVPRNTWVIVTSDHGELFGEDGYFGHGPIAHEKAFEVPFVEGRVR
jgi:sulfatase-like protein